MAKKATKSTSTTETASNETVKSNGNTRRSARLSVVSGEKEKRSKPAAKSKAKTKKKFDSKMPKKPPTAFFYFLEDFRKGFQEENPDVKSMRAIGKACGEKWKTMTYEEKVKYYDIATEKRAEFEKAMADYIKRKESGDFEETDEDSEFDE